MKMSWREISLGAASAMAGLLLASAALAKDPVCLPRVEQTLDSLNLGAGEVKEITIMPKFRQLRDGERLQGYEAWVRLQSCPGALIVDMRTTCHITQSYTRDGCSLEGVPDF